MSVLRAGTRGIPHALYVLTCGTCTVLDGLWELHDTDLLIHVAVVDGCAVDDVDGVSGDEHSARGARADVVIREQKTPRDGSQPPRPVR